MRILFLTPELPFPARSGGRIKTLKLIEHLGERVDLTLACPLKLDNADHVDQFLARYPVRNVISAPVDVPRNALSLARSYLKGITLNVLRTHSPELQGKINEVIDTFDAVIIDHYEVACYVSETYLGVRIYHAHNAYHQMWERYAATHQGTLRSVAARTEAARVLREELRLCRSSHLVFAAPNDQETLARRGIPKTIMRTTYHLPDQRALSQPQPDRSQTATRLLFVGYLGWEANSDGLRWFLETAWPRLKTLHPDLELDIAGAGADERLLSITKDDNKVRLLGFVDDLAPLYANARVAIAPLRFGSGMKVKVVESLYRGIPTVTTSVGAEGIGAISMFHLGIADTVDETVDQVHKLLTSPAIWNCMSASARQLARTRFDYDRLLRSHYQDICETVRNRQHVLPGVHKAIA